MAEAEAPLDPSAFAALLTGLLAPGARGLVLAVSGGRDSMAMMHLAGLLAAGGALPPVSVGTVDHGLQPGSAAVAARVEAEARARGLAARRLIWQGAPAGPVSQERARDARYALLADFCAEVGADHLVTAHTRDDQAETVLLRLLRGSGVGGLAAMRPCTRRGSLRLLRPLLGTSRAALRATCAEAGIVVHDDPANRDPRFARVRLRAVLPLLEAEAGATLALARLADRAGRVEEALRHAAAAAYADVARPAEDGQPRLDAARLAALPQEIAGRCLALAVTAAGGHAAPPLARLEGLTAFIMNAAGRGQAARRTLGGAVVTLGRDGVIAVAPEGPRRRGRETPRADASLGKPEADAYIRGNGSSALS